MEFIQKNLKVAFRTLRRQPVYSLLNIAGLALGMACCILIGLYVKEEMSYDQFWAEADQLYRIATDVGVQDLDTETAFTPRPLVPTLLEEFPEVTAGTRLWTDRSGDMVLRYGEHAFPESRVFFGDSTFFDVFAVELLQGNSKEALTAPYSIVITESAAQKYFGSINPVGEVLHLREPSDRDIFDYTVTGVMADLPAHSHLELDFLASFTSQRQSRSTNWLALGVYSYIKLNNAGAVNRVNEKLGGLVETHGAAQLSEAFGILPDNPGALSNAYHFFLQPVVDIHLHSQLTDEMKPVSDIRMVYMFILIGCFVLIIACMNFVNLSTALAPKRSTEIGIRKTMGSNRGQLVTQLLTESIFLSLISTGVALLLVSLALPVFREVSGRVLEFDASVFGDILPVLAGLSVAVGLLAGVYPAFYLSSFQPIKVLKGTKTGRNPRRMRNVLVVCQFSIATALIACTAIVYSQMNYMASKNLGYNVDHVIYLEGAEVLGRQAETFREEIRALAGVEYVTNSEQVPGRPLGQAAFKLPDVSDDQSLIMAYTYSSFDFVETFGMNVTQGRSLSREYASDSLAVLLNETAVQQLGIHNPIGMQLEWRDESIYTIVGVVEDFHAASLHHEIGPVALLGPDPRNTNRPNLIVSARIGAEDAHQTIEEIAAVWHAFVPDAPFDYSYLDTSLAQLYESEQRIGQLISLFTGLALTIACIGLFGLAAYIAEQRTKEMGVRKVLGATERSLVFLLTKDFSGLVVLSILIASPMAYLMMNRWLQSFAFAITPGAGIFLGAGLVALVIALAAVSLQALRAARTNPVRALRYE